jgi:hypothetical protein
MSVRVNVTADSKIEIFRLTDNHEHNRTEYDNLEDAMMVIRMLVQQDMKKADEERFVPQLMRDAGKAYKLLESQYPGFSREKNRK